MHNFSNLLPLSVVLSAKLSRDQLDSLGRCFFFASFNRLSHVFNDDDDGIPDGTDDILDSAGVSTAAMIIDA